MNEKKVTVDYFYMYYVILYLHSMFLHNPQGKSV